MLNSWIVIGVITTLVAIGSFFFRPRDIPWAAKLDRPRWLFFEDILPLQGRFAKRPYEIHTSDQQCPP